MKKILPLVCLLILFKMTGFSQSFNVQSAADTYHDWKRAKTFQTVLRDLSDGKKFIDLAAANEQTSNDPKMWSYRGKIYLEIDRDTNEVVRNLDPDAIEKSAVSFINCVRTDTRKNFAEDCKNFIWVSGVRLYNKAVAALNKGEYEKASRYFSLALEIVPLDKDNNLKRNTITSDIITYNLSRTAIKLKDNVKAKEYLQKLIDTKYNDPMIYIYMSRVHLDERDTVKALGYISQGRNIFDENTSLLNEEIRVYSLQGKYDVLINKFTDAITLNPDNEKLYYNRASLYESKKDFVKAESDYKEAIKLSDGYFEANYYLGQLYFSQAAELVKEANNLKNNEEFEKAKKNFEQKLRIAEPFLDKALDLNPKKSDEDLRLYKANLNSLKQLYARIGETEKYNKIKAIQEQK